MQGRFADSERLAQEALALGQRLQTENAAGILEYRCLPYAVSRPPQGTRTGRTLFRPATLGGGRLAPGPGVDLQRTGAREEARAEFEHLARHDFADLPRDGLWMACITYLVDVCTFLGDKDRAATLYQLLLPYAGRTVVIGMPRPATAPSPATWEH